MSKASQDAALVVTLRLSRAQAESLHDLVMDADLHEGRILYPVPPVMGMTDAVIAPLEAALFGPAD